MHFFSHRSRPSSASSKPVSIPGLTQPSLSQLLLDSKEKDVLTPQLALEAARTQLFLHAEQKRTEREKDALQLKYEEAMKSVESTQKTEMNAMSEQHQIATEAIMQRFREEMDGEKERQRKEVERFLRILGEMTKESEASTEEKQKEFLSEVRKRENQHKDRVMEIDWEYKQRIEQIRADSERVLADKRIDIRDRMIQKREKALKSLVESLCLQKLTDLKACEADFQTDIQKTRLKVTEYEAELATKAPIQPHTHIDSPEIIANVIQTYSEIGVNTDDMIENHIQSDIDSILEELNRRNSTEIEVLEEGLKAFVGKSRGKIEELERKYMKIAEQCKELEGAIQLLRTESDSIT